GLRGRQDRIERARRVGIEIVLHQPQRGGVGVVAGEQRLHKGGVVYCSAPFPHFDIAESGVGLKGEEHTARAVLFVLIMVALGFAWTQRQDASYILNEETRPLVKTQ